jgi:thiamine-phosphate pyrophosphorylase
MTLRGYYAILDVSNVAAGTAPATGGQVPVVERARLLLAAAPCMLQVRAKGRSAAELAVLARAVLPLARAAGALLCVNDRLDVALAVGADAVHLGQDDLPLADARNVARGRLLIGISTHNMDQARAAVLGGADYIGFGPIFATATKANPDPIVGVEALREISIWVGSRIPIVAIGGIRLGDVPAVAAAGAPAAALIGAIDGAADPGAAGRTVNAAFATP